MFGFDLRTVVAAPAGLAPLAEPEASDGSRYLAGNLRAAGGETFVADLRWIEAVGKGDSLQHLVDHSAVTRGFDDRRGHRFEPGLRVHSGQPIEPFFKSSKIGDR